MIVLEVRCRRSKGKGRVCRNLLGYVELHDGELRVLYNDKQPGFINQCSQVGHVSRPLDVSQVRDLTHPEIGDMDLSFLKPGAKIPPTWALGTEKKELLNAAREALAEPGKFPRVFLY